LSGNFYAHSLQLPDGTPRAESEWEPLADHLRDVATLAKEFADRFGAGEWGYLAGLWHDIGKYQKAFQRRLRDRSIHAPHAGVGAALAFQQDRQRGAPLAFAIAGHHTGLTNAVDRSCDREPLQAVIKGFGAVLPEIQAAADPTILNPPLPEYPACLRSALSGRDRDGGMRLLAFYTRMLFSALVDADRLATAEFYAKAEGRRAKHAALQYDSIAQLRDRLDGYIDNKVAAAAQHAATPINALRTEVLNACRQAAHRPPGIFSLTVPTGGGKTLAGMSFALRHAAEHGQDRVIVVIPYTSIITQNANRYKEALSADGIHPDNRNVLEHHSGIDELKLQKENPEQELRRQTAAENWDAPVIVTTTVQFFETLFSDHPSRCRKLHRIARSVIILDEVQTLPPGYLLPILESLRELVERYGCTVVLSTATPPALRQRPSLPDGLKNVEPIIADERHLFRSPAARRVHVDWRVETPTLYEELAAELAREQQVLAIVHRRQDARDLAQLLPEDGRYHLSALMCPAHRMARIAQIERCLREGAVCRLVATQLIEAGVDVDFPVVYRALAGVDSLAQAAGRCDREGKRTLAAGKPAGRFIVFLAPTSPPGETLRKALQTAQTLLKLQGADARLQEGLDLLNPEHAELFFELFYASHQLDEKNILGALAQLNFATAARDFQLIDDGGMRTIVVPWGEGRQRAERHRTTPSRETRRALQPFLVQVNQRYFDHLARRGLVEVVDEVLGLPTDLFTGDWYSEEFGLQTDPEAPIDPDVLVV